MRGGADFGKVKCEFGGGGVGRLGGEDVVGGSAEEVEVLDYTALEGEDTDGDVFGHSFESVLVLWCCGVVVLVVVWWWVGSLNWPIISLWCLSALLTHTHTKFTKLPSTPERVRHVTLKPSEKRLGMDRLSG